MRRILLFVSASPVVHHPPSPRPKRNTLPQFPSWTEAEPTPWLQEQGVVDRGYGREEWGDGQTTISYLKQPTQDTLEMPTNGGETS